MRQHENCMKRTKLHVEEGPHYPNQTYYQEILMKDPSSWIYRAPKVNKDAKILILVLSKNIEAEARNMIRATWGNLEQPYFQNGTISLVFLVGMNPEDMPCLENEDSLYHDLLIVRQKDSYRGLVYKVLMAFRYLVKAYPNAHLVKIDKDCVLDINEMMQFFSCQTTSNFLYGYVFFNNAPIHKEESKWFVPENVFNDSVYPEYVNGNFYIMSRDSFRTIVNDKKLKEVKVLELEDLFFTGIVRNYVNLTALWLYPYRFEKFDWSACPVNKFKNLFAASIYDDDIPGRFEEFMAYKKRICNSTGESLLE